jgi:hypothetical protein
MDPQACMLRIAEAWSMWADLDDQRQQASGEWGDQEGRDLEELAGEVRAGVRDLREWLAKGGLRPALADGCRVTGVHWDGKGHVFFLLADGSISCNHRDVMDAPATVRDLPPEPEGDGGDLTAALCRFVGRLEAPAREAEQPSDRDRWTGDTYGELEL